MTISTFVAKLTKTETEKWTINGKNNTQTNFIVYVTKNLLLFSIH